MISRSRLHALHLAEEERFRAAHPRCAELAGASRPRFLYGLPLHWMRDWPLPHPLFTARAGGNRVRCACGVEHLDFCLGDGAALFGHAPAPVARALIAQAAQGLGTMLPSQRLPQAGAGLARVFGLPRWQFALSASDANRFVLRWARAVTGRPKILVFDGCYHGTVGDTLVDLGPDGGTVPRLSVLGRVHDPAASSVVVPFNDAAAVEAALAAGDVACVLTEPALTNCGLVLPRAGFLEAVQAACRRAGSLFVLDETHTLCAGPGGFARLQGIAPDVLVIGKAVAGGVPCAVYGFGDRLGERMQAAKDVAPAGHSGIGTTLAGNPLALAALQACLEEVMTPQAYTRMLDAARLLHEGLQARLAAARLPWCVTRLGARLEVQFCAEPPSNAAQARAGANEPLARCLHLYCINRGVLVSPFHDMWLVAPQTDANDVARTLDVLGAFIQEMRA